MTYKLDFPIFYDQQYRSDNPQALIFLDNAATAQKPRIVIDTIKDFYERRYATIYRGMYSLAESATQDFEDARILIADFIKAREPSEIIWTKGCTEGINFIADSWARLNIKAGDEIVVTELEHHANLLPWQVLCNRVGAKLSFIPVMPNGTLDLSKLDTILTQRVKLVALNHVSNALGTCNDVATIIAAAKSVGARVLLDAAQSVPTMPVDVVALDVDFLVFSGHKLGGPTGIGVLYIKKELQEVTPPYQYGGGMVFDVDYYHATWAQAPHKYEAGTPPVAQAIGLGAAVTYMKSVGMKNVYEHCSMLTRYAVTRLMSLKGVRVLGPREQLLKHGHLVSFLVDGYHSHDVAAYLDRFNICVRAGHYCTQPLAKKLGIPGSIRMSFAVYNDLQDVDYALDCLQKLIGS